MHISETDGLYIYYVCILSLLQTIFDMEHQNTEGYAQDNIKNTMFMTTQAEEDLCVDREREKYFSVILKEDKLRHSK